MSKKTLELVVSVTSGVTTIASAVVAYLQPSYAAAIVGGIGIVGGAVIDVCVLFSK